LLTGTFVTMAITLVSVALAARSLGPHDYGVLALILNSAQAIERLVSFQSWQPLIRYGAVLDGPEHRQDLLSLLKFGLLLDVAGAVAGWLLASALALIAQLFFDIDRATMILALMFASTLLFNLNGMPTAVFRLNGRFRIVATLQVLNAAIRLACILVAYLLGAGLTAMVLVWGGTQVLGYAIVLGMAMRQLRRSGLTGLLHAPLKNMAQRFAGLWRFTWSANASLTIWSTAQQFDTLIVGALADPASAGFYYLAKRVSRLALQLGSQVEAVIYPELTRLWSMQLRGAFKRAVLQVEVLLAAFGIGCVVFFFWTAAPLMRLAAGPQFVGAAPLLVFQMIAVTFTMCGTAGRSALLAMGRQRQVLATAMVAVATFHISALLLVPRVGAMGANIAHIFLGLVWLIGLMAQLQAGLRAAR